MKVFDCFGNRKQPQQAENQQNEIDRQSPKKNAILRAIQQHITEYYRIQNCQVDQRYDLRIDRDDAAD
jgi:hypothetical protein